ncbi:MAG: 3'-5' exonuclease, partial [bacterium]
KNQGYVEVLIGGESAKANTETKSFNNMAKDKQDEIMELNEKICVDLKKEIVTRLRTFSSYSDIGILTRSNKDLTDIASELDKAGIPYVLESKDNLIEHRAIKPLYFLLSYLNYNDYFQLLKFFRSDLIGVNQKALRYMLTNKSLIESFMMNEEVVLQYEDIQKLLDEIKYIEKMNYKKLSNYIIEESGILNLYGDNSGALKNLYRFFQLMREFNSLSDFMYYINENIESEELKQVGVKEDNAVKLMTIHKSKGLSFETEFFYWNPSSGSGGGSRNMQLYINFDDKYKEANDYLLTNSKYERIFKYLNIDFAEEEDIRNLVEEINNVYVAMTRPEKNLFLYIEAPRKFTVDSEERCWTGSSYEFYENAILNAAQVDDLCELVERKQLGKLSISNRIERFEKKDILDFSEYFKSEEIDMEIIKEVNYKKDFDMTLTKEIGRIKGLVIHYYLEHIRYNTEKEKEFAEKMTRARYGNILGPEKIRKIINRINKFIENNSLYFTDEWKVFNEYELKYEDKTYRIDHLCVHKDKKEIMIIDYKSGSTKEQAQLDKYREIIGHMISGNYKIETKFLEI